MMSCSHALTIERETTETNNQESHFVPTVTELKYGILYFAGLSNITLTKPNAFLPTQCSSRFCSYAITSSQSRRSSHSLSSVSCRSCSSSPLSTGSGAWRACFTPSDRSTVKPVVDPVGPCQTQSYQHARIRRPLIASV